MIGTSNTCPLCGGLLRTDSMILVNHRLRGEREDTHLCGLACLEGWVAAHQVRIGRANEEFELAQRLDFIREQRMGL